MVLDDIEKYLALLQYWPILLKEGSSDCGNFTMIPCSPKHFKRE